MAQKSLSFYRIKVFSFLVFVLLIAWQIERVIYINLEKLSFGMLVCGRKMPMGSLWQKGRLNG